tara:strand:- start:2759 stop:3907 length:1149 start_codon:yes stop_codon:yes gene_type:complete
MNQEAGIQNAHTAAMNSLMSKYSSKLMSTESAKRAKEMLEDNVGTELIMAGLQSGRLGDMGKHLIHKALGGAALNKFGDIAEAVTAFTEKGHAGVVEHFGSKARGLASDKLREIFPDGLADRLKNHIRSTYSNAEEAVNDLGGRLTSSLRTQFERRRNISPLDRYGNNIQESPPEPIFGGYRSGISSDSGARLLQYSGNDPDLRVERAPIGSEDEMKKKFVFDELRPIQRGGRYSGGPNVMGSEIRGKPSSAVPKNASFSDAVETARNSPDALAASVVKKVAPPAEFLGSAEASQMIDNLRQKSATAAAVTESAQRRSNSELEQSANARRLAPENVLAPKRQVVVPEVQPRVRQPIDFGEVASEAALRAPGFRNEPEPFFEE